MNQLLLLAGVVIVACILMNRIAAKLPLPSLLLFIGLGMCFGVDGFFKIPFDDYELSEAICSVSLLFVMFYGGFIGANRLGSLRIRSRQVVGSYPRYRVC